MPGTDWQPTPEGLASDRALLQTVAAIYRDQPRLADQPNSNPRLGVETRALRRVGEWRLFLLLTPWMLSRLYFHDGRAPVAVPPGWSATDCDGREQAVIGPGVAFTLLDNPQRAHLNYHPRLGHYLLQPLVLAMHQYDSSAAVFAAWNEVIKVRDAAIQHMRIRCPVQEEISRREFLCGMRKRHRAHCEEVG